MNNRDQLPAHKRSQFEQLVCENGLGYCCPYALFRVTRDTGSIAARIGMSPRTVRLWKEKLDAGQVRCEKQASCMLPQIRRLGK